MHSKKPKKLTFYQRKLQEFEELWLIFIILNAQFNFKQIVLKHVLCISTFSLLKNHIKANVNFFLGF
jgi:hypothetical protein